MPRHVERTVVFYVCPGHQLLDLAGPLCALQAAAAFAGGTPYRLQVVSTTGRPVPSSVGLRTETRPTADLPLHTVVMVGGDIAPMLRPREIAAFVEVARHARRIASVCTGAFMLAAAGWLDGRRATTHWRCARRLQHEFPDIMVEGDRIFVRDEQVWTSAGITAGIDLALALIEDDLGLDVARAVAQELVVYHRRPGSQSQFSALAAMDGESDRIRRALGHARAHLAEPLPVERLAEAACLGVRQFGRTFLRETGETPARAVERLRADAARGRIEDGTEPIEAIAASVGFHNPERMRRAFVRLYGQPPQALRRLARRES